MHVLVQDEAATDVEFKAGNTMDDSHLSHGYAGEVLNHRH